MTRRIDTSSMCILYLRDKSTRISFASVPADKTQQHCWFSKTESYLSIMLYLRKPPQNCGQWNSNYSSYWFLVQRGRVWIKLELGDENLQLCWGYGRFRTPRSNVALITHDWWFCRGQREYNGVILFSRGCNTKWRSLTLKEEFKQHKYW